MGRQGLGEQEAAVLALIAERAPISAREVVDAFAVSQGLARSTVLTKLERLRRKGFLTRRRRDGVYFYSTKLPHSQVLGDLISQFVEKSLGGSVSPLVNYLIESRKLSDEEAAALRKLVDGQEEEDLRRE